MTQGHNLKVKEENGFTYFQLPLFRRTNHAFCTKTRKGEKTLGAVLGIPRGRLLTLRQVHGAEVLIYDQHTRAITYPLPYDAVITDKKRVALGRQALHASRIAFRHPTTGRTVEFTAPLPADMEAILEVLRGARA